MTIKLASSVYHGRRQLSMHYVDHSFSCHAGPLVDDPNASSQGAGTGQPVEGIRGEGPDCTLGSRGSATKDRMVCGKLVRSAMQVEKTGRREHCAEQHPPGAKPTEAISLGNRQRLL